MTRPLSSRFALRSGIIFCVGIMFCLGATSWLNPVSSIVFGGILFGGIAHGQEVDTQSKGADVSVNAQRQHEHDHQHGAEPHNGVPTKLTPEQEVMKKEMAAEFAIRLTVFHEKRAELRRLTFELRSIFVHYVNDIERSPKARQKYRDQRVAVREKLDETYDACLDAVRVGFDQDAITFIITLIQNRLDTDIYDESTFEGAARMIDSGSRLIYLFPAAARSAITSGEFDTAKRLYESLDEEHMEDIDKVMLFLLDDLEKNHLAEKSIREQEAELELPQVRLHTTQGDVLIELFIHQAPSTVTHFLGLVEQGYYEDCDFFQVVDHLIALTGDPAGTGEGNCGKFLIDEHERADARKALRGSLVMAKVPKRGFKGDFLKHSASSQFAILFLPSKATSEQQTIFGRVIEGMDAICRMRRVDPSKEKKKGEIVFPPDRIISATVVRRPEKLPEPQYVKLPTQ